MVNFHWTKHGPYHRARVYCPNLLYGLPVNGSIRLLLQYFVKYMSGNGTVLFMV